MTSAISNNKALTIGDLTQTGPCLDRTYLFGWTSTLVISTASFATAFSCYNDGDDGECNTPVAITSIALACLGSIGNAAVLLSFFQQTNIHYNKYSQPQTMYLTPERVIELMKNESNACESCKKNWISKMDFAQMHAATKVIGEANMKNAIKGLTDIGSEKMRFVIKLSSKIAQNSLGQVLNFSIQRSLKTDAIFRQAVYEKLQLLNHSQADTILTHDFATPVHVEIRSCNEVEIQLADGTHKSVSRELINAISKTLEAKIQQKNNTEIACSKIDMNSETFILLLQICQNCIPENTTQKQMISILEMDKDFKWKSQIFETVQNHIIKYKLFSLEEIHTFLKEHKNDKNYGILKSNFAIGCSLQEITIDNVFDLHEIAQTHGLKKVEAACSQFAEDNFKKHFANALKSDETKKAFQLCRQLLQKQSLVKLATWLNKQIHKTTQLKEIYEFAEKVKWEEGIQACIQYSQKHRNEINRTLPWKLADIPAPLVEPLSDKVV